MKNLKEPTKRSCEFGPFRLDTLKRLLLRDEQVAPLAPRDFDTLLALVQSAGKVPTKHALIRRVWPDTSVEENNLTVIISLEGLANDRDEFDYQSETQVSDADR
jgi:DNA-binding winged helix-turn-helix (wHTH) protein